MATVELTKANFSDVTSGEGIVLVDFWAAWCGPCRSFAPVYERVSERNPDLVFGKVDTEEEPELATEFQITSIPTLMIVRDDVVLYMQPGALREPRLDDLIDQARTIDMDDVRRKLAKRAKKADR